MRSFWTSCRAPLRPLALLALAGCLSVCALSLAGFAHAAAAERPQSRDRAINWPEGSEVLGFENLEGIILVRATLHSGAGVDTTGPFALDTGAGYLTLDRSLSHALGLSDTLTAENAIEFTDRPLARLELGELQMDQVSPVLSVDVETIRRVTDRPLLGLLGQRVFANRGLFIDYESQRLAIVPVPEPAGGSEAARIGASAAAFRDVISRRANPIPFRLAGDGKILVRCRVSDPRPPRFSAWLTFIMDTGSTKCVLFEEAAERFALGSAKWTALNGLAAPTLMGSSRARVARVPAFELSAGASSLRLEGVDIAIMRSEISTVLTRSVGEPVHGLLGYSFLRRFRIAIDYPRRLMWLDPRATGRDERRYEYSHVGLQLERVDGAVRVMAVAEGSPAQDAGISEGDEVVAIDGRSADELDILGLTRLLEGAPGTIVRLTMRRGSSERTYMLVRRRLI